jgi:hypothetical protein
MRAPDFIIGPPGKPYLRRWWVIPRNRFFNIYLHQILADDDARARHDHPWWNISIIFSGAYWEDTPFGVFLRRAGSVVFRRPSAAHRLVLRKDGDGKPQPCWSLFITGPVVREWGFHTACGWKHWKECTVPGQPGVASKIPTTLEEC